MQPNSEIPLIISGLTYFTASDAAQQMAVSRQTLWRWRQEAKIPPDHRFRNRHVVLTPAMVKEIEQYATWIDPIDPPNDPHRDLLQGA